MQDSIFIYVELYNEIRGCVFGGFMFLNFFLWLDECQLIIESE